MTNRKKRNYKNEIDNRENRNTTIDKVKKVISLIADGESYKKSRELVGIGNGAFFEILSKNPELWEQYARAREFRSETFVDKIEELEQKVADGEINHNAARVIIDAEKWKASKFYPKLYGDKQQVDMNVQSFDLFAKAVEERAKIYEDQQRNIETDGK